MKRTLVALAFETVVLVHGIVAQSAPHSSIPLDSEIRQILAERIDKERQSVGIVVGVIEPRGRRIIAYGNLDKVDKRPVDGDTIFELGSVTKVFTALLLADMVHRGEVGLTDPVAQYLPAEVKMPERGGRQITLQDLATHTSGLPPMPSNFEPKDANNPFADYSVKQLYQFLSGYQLTRDIGSQYEYSNVGGGLLGQVLATRAGMNYDDLLRSRICELLSMNDTRITLSKELRARLAIGHDQSLEPASNWDGCPSWSRCLELHCKRSVGFSCRKPGLYKVTAVRLKIEQNQLVGVL
jgi:serine-type D-Ala-D-Ala carboxypeptidase/endopeptidase